MPSVSPAGYARSGVKRLADYSPGTRLADRFEVIGLLGRGGMATVYLVEDHVRGARVALKVLHSHLAHDPAMRRRLRREVDAASLVRHDAALVAYDLHPIGDSLALSMPFHGGTTLAERVKAHGPLDEAEVRQLGIRLGGVLAEAHRRGVLHRDVTPNNVMLTSASDAVLTDFGLARTQASGTATATSVMGTPGYAAPEVYAGQRTDPRSDLYSLGAVLYFAATGRSPYGGGAPAAVLRAQLTDDPTSVRALRPELSDDIAATIDALLCRDADQRPPSAQEVRLAFETRRAAVVTEVPDTWDPETEPVVRSATRAPQPLPEPVEPPHGDFEVVVEGRSGAEADELADNVAELLALPAGALEVTKPMRTRRKKFLLMRGTDKATARQLANAARSAGYGAEVFDVRPAPLRGFLSALIGMMVPLVWIAFPFVLLDLLGSSMAIFVGVLVTFIAGPLAAAVHKKKPDAKLLTALPGAMSRHVRRSGAAAGAQTSSDGMAVPDFLKEFVAELAADEDLRKVAETVKRGLGWGSALASAPPPAPAAPAEPAPAPVPEPEVVVALSRTEELRGRALGNIDLLASTVGELELPDVARRDLQRTADSLRERADQLSRVALGLEQALAAMGEPEDTSWIRDRLTRLETMDRAGDAMDPEERDRLSAALESAEAAAASHDHLESRLTSALAQLLEVGALATRARADLLAEQDVPGTARLLREEIDRQVDAIDAARRELASRKATRG